MRFWKLTPESFTAQAHAYRASCRDDIMGIGPEGYAEFNTISRRRITGFGLEPSQSPRQLEEALANPSTTPRANTYPPTEHINAPSKRPAPAPPANQPSPKKLKPSPPTSPPRRRFPDLAAKRLALTQPPNQPARKKARIFIPADASGGGAGFDETPIPLAGFAGVAAKRNALARRVGALEVDGGRVFVAVDGRGGWEERLTGFRRDWEAMRGAENAEIEGDGGAAVDKGKVHEDKVDGDGDGDSDSDSDVCEVIEAKSSPAAPRWKLPAAAKSASEKKGRGKQSVRLEDSDAEPSPSTKKPGVKASDARGKSVSQAVDVDESESAGEGSEQEEGDSSEEDESESEHEDPRVGKKKLARAHKELSKACRSCKINANKEWKTKYDTMVSELNREHKAATKILKDTAKADGIAAAKKAKATLDKEKKTARAKADNYVEGVRETWGEKFEAMKTKLDAEIKAFKKNFAAQKTKVAELRLKVERVEADRKKIEKDAAEKVKKADADLKAEGLRLKEQNKQYKRELAEEVVQLKPEHSNVVKAKDKAIKDAKQEYSRLELELERSEDDLRRARRLRGEEKDRHGDTAKKLAGAKARVDELEANACKFQNYLRATEQRAQTDVARAEEQTATVQANLQQQSNRVVDKQRDNYLLQDALRQKAGLAEARKLEIAVLAKQLREAQAELGVAREMEKMEEVVEEVKGKTAEAK